MGLTDSGVDGGGAFSLSSSSSNTMGFSTDHSVDESSNVVGEKGVSMAGLRTVSMSNCEFSQLNSMSSRSDTWIAARVQVLSPRTGEYFVSHLRCSL